jgi:hypothetical protein
MPTIEAPSPLDSERPRRSRKRWTLSKARSRCCSSTTHCEGRCVSTQSGGSTRVECTPQELLGLYGYDSKAIACKGLAMSAVGDRGRKSTKFKRRKLVGFMSMVAIVHLFSTTGCSRTVHWEEEVPLNTGETIWVQRNGTYTYKSVPGNPLDYGYYPDWVSTTRFKYKGSVYSFTDSASLVLLAIGPDGSPTLVADAANHDWQWNNQYYCVTPFYVQFRSDRSGKTWMWPPRIESWLYGLSTNLIIGLPPLESSGKKFSVEDRLRENAPITVRKRELRAIDPTYLTNICPTGG